MDDTDMWQAFVDSLGDHAATDGEVAYGPVYAEPDSATTGNQPLPDIPDPVPYHYSYVLDVADTGLNWQPGAPLDTSAIRQYIVDLGYLATTVESITDEDGLDTGQVRVRLERMAYVVDIAVEQLDALSAEDTATPAECIPETNIPELQEGYTYSGEITYRAEMMRDDGTGDPPTDDLSMTPVFNGVAEDAVIAPSPEIGWGLLEMTLPVSALAGGTIPTVGMLFGGDNTGDTLMIRNATITGTLVADGSIEDQISAPEWAAYTGARGNEPVATVVVWADTAEGAITPVPDLKRLVAFWNHLMAQPEGIEVVEMTGSWNFATPGAAPANPEITVYSGQAISPEIIASFLYAEIDNAALDAFNLEWNAAVPQSTIERKSAQKVATPGQDDRSTPAYYISTTDPTLHTDDVRERDIWQKTDEPPESEWRKRINGVWVVLPDGYVLTNENSTSTGRLSVASNVATTANGAGAEATGLYSTAVGALSDSSGNQTVAVGNASIATGGGGTAVGVSAEASAPNTTATGNVAVASGDNSTAIGDGSTADGDNATAVGASASASGESATAIGRASVASGVFAAAVGVAANASGDGTMALGANSTATQDANTAIGVSANASGPGTVAIGYDSQATDIAGIAIGVESEANAQSSIAIGYQTVIPSTAQGVIALGHGLTVPGGVGYKMYVSATTLRIVRVFGVGSTYLELASPDETYGLISVTNDDKILVNGQAQNIPADGSITPTKLDRAYMDAGKILSGSGFVDLATIAAGATGVGTITVTGAAAGDVALVSASSQIESGLVFKQAWVSNTNEVSFAITNITGSSINPSGRSWYARVIKS